MLLEDQHPHNKSISATLIGAPNAGKSTLVNTLLGFDLSIVSDRPQTTRNFFHCAFTIDHTEIVLIDTPGVHKLNQEINIRMNNQVNMALETGDVILALIDPTEGVEQEAQRLGEVLNEKDGLSVWVLFTKEDCLKDFDQSKAQDLVNQKIKGVEKTFLLSAKEDTHINELITALCEQATFGPHLYPDGSVSNKNERFFASEYIREQAIKLLKDELPYEVAVVIDEYKDYFDKKDPSKNSAHISASILVNRPSQRAIVVGKKGSVIKEIGIRSREKIQAMTGVKVHLNLHVKVSPRWFSNNFVLTELGLPRSQTQTRSWRKR